MTDAAVPEGCPLHSCPMSTEVVQWTTYLGLLVLAIVVLKWVWSVLGAVWIYFLRPGRNLKSFGDWAVVTGCTDGIGRAYAKELARKGLNVVLVSRSADKLASTASEIQELYPNVETKTVQADFSHATPELYERIRVSTAGLRVGVLVNNVGVSYPYPQYFHELSQDALDALIKINVDATTEMTRMFLPDMQERKKGAVLFVTSAAGEVPQGLLAVYSATKAYVSSLSRSLSQEYRASGVHVQLVVPLFVTSKLSKIRKTSFFVPSADRFARDAVRAIGYDEVTTPYWPHRLQMYVGELLPAAISEGYTFSMHKSIRRRALKKLEQKK